MISSKACRAEIAWPGQHDGTIITMSNRAWLLLLCLALIWGASFYFIEIGLIYLDPFWLVSLRLTSGAAALFFWIRINGLSLPRDRRFWGQH